ncbi:uncharacterized protein LOC144356574 [Saccoglossus kowalevskii]
MVTVQQQLHCCLSNVQKLTYLGSFLEDKVSRVIDGLLHYLPKLRLAHPVSYDESLNIDILIGADRYWDFIGVDFTGAVFVSVEKSERKAYICLFTCAVTRAIHLELVMDLSTDTFLRAFRRFAARRSLPSKIISDNGSTYLSAAKEIQKLFESASIQNYFANHRMEWSFIPKRAPWFGGFWERLIGMTKTSLKKVLGRAFVSVDELQTVLTEIEATLNDRPLTYLSSDSNDLLPLTPSHFLHGRLITTMPYYSVDEEELNDPTYGNFENLQRRSEHLAKIQNHFWKRWAQEYLNSLREQDRLSGKGALQNQIRVGDIVLVEDTSVPRIKWKLAMIEQLNTGNDGLVRSAYIRTATGKTSRPITKLYPLEVNYQLENGKNYTPTEGSVQSKVNDTNIVRPTRKAATKARQRFKVWSSILST